MSKLRGIKPEKIEKRLKAFFYGRAGVGKTLAAIQFPVPYLIDTEKGSENKQYIKLLEKSGGSIFQTTDFNEMMQEVRSLLTEKHHYKTLIIDPMTHLYSDLITKCEVNGTEYGKHYRDAEKRMKELIAILYQLDMNVIITSHSKNEYSMNGKEMSILGQTFDCYKKIDYFFDLAMEIQKRGKDRIAVVKKSRIETFEEDSYFKFSYEEVANRYGKESFEKDSVPIKLASQDQIHLLRSLVELYKEPEETVQKWLDKAIVSSFEEMSEEVVSKLITYMEKKSEMLNKKEKNTVINIKGAA